MFEDLIQQFLLDDVELAKKVGKRIYSSPPKGNLSFPCSIIDGMSAKLKRNGGSPTREGECELAIYAKTKADAHAIRKLAMKRILAFTLPIVGDGITLNSLYLSNEGYDIEVSEQKTEIVLNLVATFTEEL